MRKCKCNYFCVSLSEEMFSDEMVSCSCVSLGEETFSQEMVSCVF